MLHKKTTVGIKAYFIFYYNSAYQFKKIYGTILVHLLEGKTNHND